MLVHHKTLVSFRLFRTNLGHLREFLRKMAHRPANPQQKMAIRLCYEMWSIAFIEQ